MCMNPIHRELLIKEHTRMQQTLICEFRTFILWWPLTTVAMRQAEEHHRKSHHACKQAIPAHLNQLAQMLWCEQMPTAATRGLP